MSAESTPELREGDWLDVVDGDGIWNVAQVLRLPTADSVEVTYDCWGDEYNEELPRDSPRIAPFHTHTYAVKCWAKLDTWPWWPALLTVRAPGSDRGSNSLRLEERLLVDFLDKAVFTERCRCWVKKSKVVPFQSDEEARKRLLVKAKRKRKAKGDARLRNLGLSTSLLAQCDAREDFPEFVEGTLPVKFKRNFIPPAEEVREEMGEQIWLRGFADNRVNHAATHGYTPVIGTGENPKKGSEETPKPAEKNTTSKAAATDKTQTRAKNGATTEGEVGENTSVPKEIQSTENNQSTAQGTKTRKRSRHIDDNENSDGTDSSQASASKPPCEQSHSDDKDGEQGGKLVADERLEAKNATSAPNKINATQELRVASRKYGKTPKVLKTSRRSAANLPLYTPPHARVLQKVKPQKEQQTTRISHTGKLRRITEARPHAKKGTANEKLPAAGQQPRIDVKSTSIDAKSDGESVSPMTKLARMTKVTVEAGKKLEIMEGALGDKLKELAKKSTKAEKLRFKCAALLTEESSHKRAPATEVKRNDQENSQRENTSNNLPDTSRVPALARRSSEAKCSIRGLELALDARISKYQGSAVTTREDFDAIKADLLNSQEVQAAISRIQSPSYRWTACTAKALSAASSLSSEDSRRAFEKAKSGYAKYRTATGYSDPKRSLRSPSRQFGRSWGYESERGSSDERSLESAPADHSNFGFSVNDNFSMSQWYRDLYPKAFNCQQP